MDSNIKEFILSNLPNFKKPLRYIGGELNSIVKERASLRVGVCYPDLYEIGMGNLALKILYHTINQHTDFAAERVFAPFVDFEKFLRENRISLYTLETFTELNKLDLLAITIPYELVYTNILNILDLGGIPLYSENRDYPLIIGGGPILNPEPLAKFFDGFFIGEADSAIIEILETVKEWKNKLDKKSLLLKLERIKGFYSPILHEIKYEDNFFVDSFDFKIEKRVEKDIDALPSYFNFPIAWDVIHDKESIEIARGCYHRCRFCSSSVFYKPVREKSIRRIEEAVEKYFISNGSLEFSLLSLSSADYSRIDLLLERLNRRWSVNFLTFYLPSLKINSFSLDLLDKLSYVKKTGLTLALESPDENYRRAINKEVSDSKLFEIIDEAKKRGWRHVKIYLMIGFFDINEEKERIFDFVKKLSQKNEIDFNISLNIFIPKPFTPFERKKLYKPDEILPVLREIKVFCKNFRNINLSYSDPYMSYIEGILSRGSRETAWIIEEAFKRGARFDGHDEFFNKEIWFDILKSYDCSIFEKEIKESLILPWYFIDPLVSIEFISKEYERSLSFESSSSCDEGCKDYCGACKEVKNIKAKDTFYDDKAKIFFKKDGYKKIVGLVFEKKGPLIYLSTIDTLRLFERVLVKSKLPLVFTSGFNPKIKIEFGFLSPVGYPSSYENVRIFLWEDVDEDEIKSALENSSSGLLKVVKTKSYNSKPPSLQVVSKYFVFSSNKFLLDKVNLLSFIKNRYDFYEKDENVVFSLPCNEFKILKEYNFYNIERIKVLNSNRQEVI